MPYPTDYNYNPINDPVNAANAAATVGYTAPTSFAPLGISPVSTTTLSTANKIDEVNKNIGTLNQYEQSRGITTDPSGVSRLANGSIYDQPYQNYLSAGGNLSKDAWESAHSPTGGEITQQNNNTALQPGQAEDSQIFSTLDQLKASSDAATASMIEGIQRQFAARKSEQETINRGQSDTVRNILSMGGVTGGGGSIKYAPISSQGIISAQESYGIKRLNELDIQEQQLIAQARAAQVANDFKIMSLKIDQVNKIRDEKIKATDELNKTIAEESKKRRDELMQFEKEGAILDLYDQGVRDMSTMVRGLREKGINASIADVQGFLSSVSPDKAKIRELANKLSEKGATDDILKTVLSAETYEDALLSSQGILGQMTPEERLDFQIKQATLAQKYKDLQAISKEEKDIIADSKKLRENAKLAIPDLQAKISKFNSLLNSAGLKSAVGPNILGRISLLEPFTAQSSNFVASIEQVIDQLGLDKLIESKAQGATFGALSDNELRMLNSAATKLASYRIKEGDTNAGKNKGLKPGEGRVVGYKTTESEFKSELERIRAFAEKDLKLKQEQLTADIDLLLDSVEGEAGENTIKGFYGE